MMPISRFGRSICRCVVAALVLAILVLPARAEDFKAPLARMELADGDSVVFLGDSITHQCLYTQYVEDYYYTRFPDRKITFHNAGVGGARARDALDRFDRDVAAYKPKYVTVLLGMNDGGYRPYDEATFQTYRSDMAELLEKIRGIGAIPILMTPTMFDSRAARLRGAKNPPLNLELYNATLAYYGAWLRETAVESGAGFVDMYSPLNNLTLAARKQNPNFTMIRDAVHPDPPGQLVMAYALLHDLDSRGTVFDLHFQAGSGTEGGGTGASVTEVTGDATSLEFTLAASALPLVVPAEAEPGAKLVYLGHVLGRASLAVAGFPRGHYELTIDGQSIGFFDAGALAQGVDLGENSRTPDYQQAQQVAELNKKRNEGPVKLLRNEWSQMQQFYRLGRQAKAAPDDQELAKKLAEQTQRVEGLEERIARHEQAARDIEQQILAINRPKSHKYRIGRVELTSATARVTLNGKPLANAEILLEGSAGRRARGLTAADGTCNLAMSETVGLVAAGEYRITVRAPGVPERLSNADTSGLRFVVVPQAGKNKFSLELKN